MPSMLRESLLMNTVDLALATERTLLLLGCYRRSDVGDPEIFTRAVIAVFMRYPESVVVPVTEPATGLPAKLKWLPSIAEIREACERAMEPILRQRERERIEDEWRRALPAPPRDARPTMAELHERYPILRLGREASVPRRQAFRSLGEIAAEAGVSAAQIDAAK